MSYQPNMKLVKQYLFFIALSAGLTANAQLTCEDFKTGKFYIPLNEVNMDYRIEENDSITNLKYEKDSLVEKYIVVRKEKSQIEWKNGIGNGDPEHEIIEWIDDCTYRLKYDASKSELDEAKKWVNENNGIVVTKSKIEGNCMFYIATMTTKDGQVISHEGVLCKE